MMNRFKKNNEEQCFSANRFLPKHLWWSILVFVLFGFMQGTANAQKLVTRDPQKEKPSPKNDDIKKTTDKKTVRKVKVEVEWLEAYTVVMEFIRVDQNDEKADVFSFAANERMTINLEPDKAYKIRLKSPRFDNNTPTYEDFVKIPDEGVFLKIGYALEKFISVEFQTREERQQERRTEEQAKEEARKQKQRELAEEKEKEVQEENERKKREEEDRMRKQAEEVAKQAAAEQALKEQKKREEEDLMRKQAEENERKMREEEERMRKQAEENERKMREEKARQDSLQIQMELDNYLKKAREANAENRCSAVLAALKSARAMRPLNTEYEGMFKTCVVSETSSAAIQLAEAGKYPEAVNLLNETYTAYAYIELTELRDKLTYSEAKKAENAGNFSAAISFVHQLSNSQENEPYLKTLTQKQKEFQKKEKARADSIRREKRVFPHLISLRGGVSSFVALGGGLTYIQSENLLIDADDYSDIQPHVFVDCGLYFGSKKRKNTKAKFGLGISGGLLQYGILDRVTNYSYNYWNRDEYRFSYQFNFKWSGFGLLGLKLGKSVLDAKMGLGVYAWNYDTISTGIIGLQLRQKFKSFFLMYALSAEKAIYGAFNMYNPGPIYNLSFGVGF